MLQLSINEIEKLEFELEKRGKMSKDPLDPMSMHSNSNNLKRLINVTKHF